MPRIAFFVPEPSLNGGPPANDNHQRLPVAFEARGWVVARVERESVAVANQRLVARTVAGDDLELAGFDLYFPLGFGTEVSFLDRMQLLRGLDQRRFVNTIDALIHQHGKTSLILACPEVPQPAAHLGNDAAGLAAIVAGGGDWIAKPPASSFGRQVFRLRAGDTNVRAILEHLTRDRRYALLQEYLEPGPGGEKRVLMAADRVIGAYRKQPLDHRGNIDAGATAHPTVLSNEEQTTVERLLGRLDALGVRFATADLIDARVLEINVANPGWLQTYQAATGVDLTAEVVAALSDRWDAT